MSCGQTTGQPPVLLPHQFTLDSLCSCLRRDIQDSCSRYSGGLEGRLAPGPTKMSAQFLAQLCAAPPSAVRRADPTRPLCVRVLDSTNMIMSSCLIVTR